VAATQIIDVSIKGQVAVAELVSPDVAIVAVRRIKADITERKERTFCKAAQTTVMRVAVGPITALRSKSWSWFETPSWCRYGRNPADTHVLVDGEGKLLAASRLRSGGVELWCDAAHRAVGEEMLKEWGAESAGLEVQGGGPPQWAQLAKATFDEQDREREAKGKGKSKGMGKGKGKKGKGKGKEGSPHWSPGTTPFPPAVALETAASGRPAAAAAAEEARAALRMVLADPSLRGQLRDALLAGDGGGGSSGAGLLG